MILIILAIVSPYKPTESVPITSNVVSLNPLMARCTQYNIYEIKFVSDLQVVSLNPLMARRTQYNIYEIKFVSDLQVVSLNPLMARCTQYNIYEIKFVSDLHVVNLNPLMARCTQYNIYEIKFVSDLHVVSLNPLMARCTQYNIYEIKVCQWLVSGRLFSPGTLVFSTKKTYRRWNIVESGVKHPNPINLLGWTSDKNKLFPYSQPGLGWILLLGDCGTSDFNFHTITQGFIDTLNCLDVISKLLFQFTFSVRLNERRQRGVEDNKKIAYLLDLKTVAVGRYYR